MKLGTIWLAIASILAFTNASVAQFDYDFFWSDKTQGEGAENGDLMIDVAIGETVTLYSYWTTNGPSNSGIDLGCGVDVSTSTPGIIRFDAAETLEFDIVLTSAPDVVLFARWQFPDGNGGYGGAGFSGPAFEVTDDFIDRLWAFALGSEGIIEDNNGSGPFLDTGYDPGPDAFLWGQMTFTAMAPGLVEVITVTDQTGCVGHDDDTLDVVYSSLFINVEEPDKILLGDVNLDGVVSLLDIQPFSQIINNLQYQLEADMNQDGIVSLLDVTLFVDTLMNQ